MFSYFRKIRWRLAANSSASERTTRLLKYGRYAIGEILLVVIGILIALQINQWNEEHKARKEAIVSLQKLKEEFITNAAMIDTSLIFHERSKTAAYILKNQFNPGPGLSNDSLDLLVIDFFSSWKYEPFVSSIDPIIDSGKLSLISNDSLTGYIRYWKTIIEKYDEMYQNKDQYQRQTVMPMFVEKYPFRELEQTGVVNFESDRRQIFSSMKNENVFIVMEYEMTTLLEWSKHISTVQLEIIEMIDNELSKK